MQPYIAMAVAFGIAGLLAFPGAIGLRLRMVRLKSAELVLFVAMAAIGIIGYGSKFSPTNDPPRSAGAPQLITPDPGTGPFTNIAPFEVSNLCFTAIAVTPTSLWAAVAWPPALSPTNAATNATTFRIRGKNPLDSDAKAYIDSNVDAEFASYAWMIAKHESKSGSRVYNQFNPANPLKELPNKTSGQNRWGWGMGQIDKGTTGCVTAVVYDWHRNVSEINATLRSKANRYEEVVRWFREAYQNDTTTSWFEPDGISTNVGGVVLSANKVSHPHRCKVL